jgi:hypothetical protein
MKQRAKTTSKNTEILCFLAKDEATADRLAAKLRSVVKAKSPDFDGTKVSVEKGDRPFVRAIVPDSASQPPGRLLRTDLDLWLAMHDI